ncbi:hypothetical protein CPC08DRAFT_748819 [Agrocybe pediades]|nr:hypothetical protein CPC08DRAFT_748819 [Agrocybe pediades]
MQPIKFYQLGGYHGHIKLPGKPNYDDYKELARVVFESRSSHIHKSNRVELALGIKPSGSSHLLLNEDQVGALMKDRQIYTPRDWYKARIFDSISPIYFGTLDELSSKLNSLKAIGSKGDTSQANKAYREGHDTPLVFYRGVYENGRVIYNVLQKNLDPYLYGLPSTAWTQQLRVVAFVQNSNVYASRAQKVERPVVLDIGLCEASIPSLDPRLATCRHIVNSKTKLLAGGPGRPRTEFHYAESEDLSEEEIRAQIHQFFSGHQTSTRQPILIIVFDREITLAYLRTLGINTDDWRDGARDLLIAEDKYSEPTYRERGASSSKIHDRSPRRGVKQDTDFQSNRRPSPLRSASRPTDEMLYPPVSVIDIKKLYATLTNIVETDDTTWYIDTVARTLGIAVPAPGMCAGNEAVLALDVWKFMISGDPIDERRKVLHQILKMNEANASLAMDENDEEEEEEEPDPNNMPSSVPQAAASNAISSMADEDSDYGGDDDSD